VSTVLQKLSLNVKHAPPHTPHALFTELRARPVQVAGQSTVIGVLFRSVGMIYLVDLDDIAGSTMTLVSTDEDTDVGNTTSYGSSGKSGSTAGKQPLDEKEFDAEKQKIIQEAVKDVETKLQALARGERPSQARSRMSSITGALFMFNKNSENDEETPLV